MSRLSKDIHEVKTITYQFNICSVNGGSVFLSRMAATVKPKASKASTKKPKQEAFVKFAKQTKGKDTEQRKAMAERVRAQNANSARGSGGQSQRAKARASARQRLKGK